MEYANAVNAAYQNQNSLKQQVEAPRTISSAASRIDGLNDRLLKTYEALAMISSQLGALTPVNGQSPVKDVPSPSGAVHRLNESADKAHGLIGDIENLIQGISRALG